MTKYEIIMDTANYYSDDTTRRGINEETGACVYLTSEGKMCGVGRCLKNPTETLPGAIDSLMDKSVIMQDDFLEEYQGHEAHFWMSIQMFHDSDSNWNKSGLSEKGQKALQLLIDNYQFK